jgi:two-component system sensor histidine kinase/response regulator
MDAGMDGYLTKPIEVAALARVIEERLPAALDLRRERDPSGGGPAPGTTVQTAGPAVDPEVFDQARLVDVFGDFGPAARAFLDEFLASIPARLEGLAAAVEAADAEQGRDIAHSLKGAALSVGANRLGQLASDVQDAYDQDDPDTAAIMVTLLEPTYQELIAGLEPLRAA